MVEYARAALRHYGNLFYHAAARLSIAMRKNIPKTCCSRSTFFRLSKKARWAFFDKKMQPAARIIFAA